jgi:hypothetical protein
MAVYIKFSTLSQGPVVQATMLAKDISSVNINNVPLVSRNIFRNKLLEASLPRGGLIPHKADLDI